MVSALSSVARKSMAAQGILPAKRGLQYETLYGVLAFQDIGGIRIRVHRTVYRDTYVETCWKCES